MLDTGNAKEANHFGVPPEPSCHPAISQPFPTPPGCTRGEELLPGASWNHRKSQHLPSKSFKRKPDAEAFAKTQGTSKLSSTCARRLFFDLETPLLYQLGVFSWPPKTRRLHPTHGIAWVTGKKSGRCLRRPPGSAFDGGADALLSWNEGRARARPQCDVSHETTHCPTTHAREWFERMDPVFGPRCPAFVLRSLSKGSQKDSR